MSHTGTGPDRKRHTEELVEAGTLLPVRLEGHKPLLYMPAEDLPRLDAAASADAVGEPRVSFIAPLDPFVWDRQIIRDAFGFDYLWEVYVPEHKRRWGYYVLPILYSDRLVGRIEPRLERKTGTLRIAGVWWQDGFAPRAAPDFVEQMGAALREYMNFVGATTLEWAAATGSASRTFGNLKGRRSTSG
jgi:uncharacterized protein YcaQ